MKLKTLAALICAATLLLCAVSGCTIQPSAPAQTPAPPTPEPAPKENTLTVRVISVQDGVVTAESGKLSGSGDFIASNDGGTVEFTVGPDALVSAGSKESPANEAPASAIQEQAILEVTLVDNAAASVIIKAAPVSTPEPVYNGTAAVSISKDCIIDGETYASEAPDENALRVEGAVVTLGNITIEKPARECSNPEAGSLHGMNAALLAQSGAAVSIQNAAITSDAMNGNGVFSYGPGAAVTAADSVIRTSGQDSCGLRATYGAGLNALRLAVETRGDSSPAISGNRSTISIEGGNYMTYGKQSPAIYSAAGVSAADAAFASESSAAAVIDGAGSISLINCALNGNMQEGNDEAILTGPYNILLHDSGSDDIEGDARFLAAGGSITARSGDMFNILNTACTIELSDVLLTLANDVLMRVSGSACTFSASDQHLIGDILVDKLSSLELSLSRGCVFGGAINPDGQAGNVSMVLGDDCTWLMTADSYLTAFDGDPAKIITNGHTLHINGQPYFS